jgi:hypothetical protein
MAILRPGRFCFRAWFAAACACLACLGGVERIRGAETSLSEYQIKALFLFNFAKYVDWPAETFPTTNAPITIGVLGQDNFKDALKHAIEGKTVDGRAIVFKHVTTDAEAGGCHILFVSSSEKPRLDEILGKTRALPVLTVGEHDQFLEKGGIINFTLKEGNVRLQVNLDAARRAKVEISSKLLSVAEVVKTGSK